MMSHATKQVYTFIVVKVMLKFSINMVLFMRVERRYRFRGLHGHHFIFFISLSLIDKILGYDKMYNTQY